MQNALYKYGANFDRGEQKWYFAAGLPDVEKRWNKVPGLKKRPREPPQTPEPAARGSSAEGPPPLQRQRRSDRRRTSSSSGTAAAVATSARARTQ